MARVYDEVLLKQKVVKEQYCDWCFKKCYASGTVNFGYGSSYDGDSVRFDICDECYGNILRTKCKDDNFEPQDTPEHLDSEE